MKWQLLIFFTVMYAATATAQSITPEVVSSAGGDSTNASASLSWTIGEPVSETLSGSGTTITQGFHQQHFEVISIEEYKESGFDIKIYPNPSTEVIHVEMTVIDVIVPSGIPEFDITLSDPSGKIIMRETVKNKWAFPIPMQEYAAGQYFIRIRGTDGDLYKSVQVTKLR